MSLHNLASQIQSRGRGEDKMLVHMTPGEVQGLQALAMKHGGSLTINPETGLPEAGFLKRILPTVVGAGAMFIPGMQPIGAAMLGAGVGLATSGGNLRAGIMGGLGAWGGASLVGGMMGAGAGALGSAAAPAAELAGTEALMATGFTPTTASIAPGQVSELVSKGVLDQSAASAYGNAYSSAFSTATPGASIQEGFKQAVASPDAFFKQNMFPIGAAVLPSLMSSQQSGGIGTPQSQGQIRPYTYAQERNPDFGIVPGAPYFKQSYTAGEPYTAKEGGIIALASGGPVERMSQMNTAMNPQGGFYPQGMIDAPQYATSTTQRPISSELVSAVPAYEQAEPMLMAAGGAATVPQVNTVPLAPATDRYTTAPAAPSQAVQDYNKLIATRAANEYVTQPSPLSLLPGGGERATAEDTSKIINQYYLKNLGRQADQPGLEYWTKQKMDTGMSLADINKAIGESGEANIRNFYKQNYGRYATPEEIAGVQKRYAAGEAPETIISGLKQEALEKNPKYKEYMAAPISEANFDAAQYLKDNPDVANPALWKNTPWAHYLEATAKGEKRVATKKPFETAPAKTKEQTGYTYDPVTQRYTEPTAAASTDPLQDPAFLEWQKQDQFRRWQQSQNPGDGSGHGGKAGGLMPYNLKSGGISDLGDYSDGGRLLKGPGDGVSDSIPAQIGARQPARLADGEFVVPARIVSELGNGSTDAGARKLYAMMDRIQNKRRKSIGKGKVAVDSKSASVLPA